MLFNTLLVIVLSVSGVLSQMERGVIYTPTGGVSSSAVNVKCLKVDINSDTVSGGDTVELTCRETCSWRGNSFIWYKNEQLLTDYYRNSQSYRNLKFTARSKDTGRYSCAVNDHQHLVSPAVNLSVRCVTVEMKSNTVSEGVRVTLTCKITCTDLTGSQTFIWYKNGQYLSHTTQKYQNHDLQFIASIGDAGSYSCAVRGHENLPSPAVTLCLKVDINSDTVSGGETVELTCGATCTHLTESNSFIWYKNEQLLPDDYRFSQSHRILTFTARSGDTGRYSCAVRDNQHLVSPAVTLSVRCVKVEIKPSTVNEGVSVTLTCKITCTDLTGSQTFIWNKNGQYLSHTTQTYQNHDLQFKASSGHAGSYSCAVTGHENLPSPAVTLSVRYSPKSTSVSVSPSGKIVEGSSVTLTCSSDANPPVERYTWYKNNRAVSPWGGSGRSYTIKTITLQDAVEYYCEAQNGIGTNRSPPKRLGVQYPPKSVSVSVSPSGEIVEGSSVTLTCSSDANPPVQNYTWYKKNDTEDRQAGSGQSLNFSNFGSWNRGQYYCEAQNRLGAQNASALLVLIQDLQTGSERIVSFSNFTSWSFGQYYCVALNTHGDQTSAAEDRTALVWRVVGIIVAFALFAVMVCTSRKKSTNRERGEQTLSY